jgi:[ribosomal protein S5]-alanine N-acetyltransferase
MIETRLISLEDIEAWLESPEQLSTILDRPIIEQSLLPVDSFLEFLNSLSQRPLWTGVWGFVDGGLAGSAMFKSDVQYWGIEIGYGVSPFVEGRGLATAMARHLVEYAFENGVGCVRAHTLHDGFASQRVLEKVGFSYIGDFDEPGDGLVRRFEIRATSSLRTIDRCE